MGAETPKRTNETGTLNGIGAAPAGAGAGTDAADVSSARRLLDIVTGSWMTQAACVAAELQIPDLLAKCPRTSDDLAAATGTHAPSLHRLLRALTAIGICHERDDGSFETTSMGSLLAAEAPASLRHWTIWWGRYLWPVWGRLLDSVKTGQSARKLLFGTEGFEHLDGDPSAAAVFNQALAELTRLACESVVRAYDFAGTRLIVDVGGGYGELLVSILMANPAAEGVLFDLPQAIEGARRHIGRAGLAERCRFIAGDFFEGVPGGGEAYVLKSVIHDWDDDRGKQILENCRQAMPAGARLLVIEQVLPDRLDTSAAHQSIARSDLNMLVAQSGRQRTRKEFQDLLRSAGFGVTRIVPAEPTFTIIEACPVP